MLSCLWGQDTELDEPALGVSPLSGTAGLHYDFEEWPLFLEGMSEIVSKQDRVAAIRGETSTGGYTLADVQGGWSIGNNITVQFGVKNLFDRQYVNHLNAKNPYTTTPVAEPRRVFFGDISIQL